MLGLELLPEGPPRGLPPLWPGLLRPSPRRAASGPTALFRNTKAAGAAIGSVKNMLLEWCRAMTRNYEVGTGQGPFPRAAVQGLSRWEAQSGPSPGSVARGSPRRAPACPPAARGHPELLLQLEQRHGLLRPHPQVLPRRLRLRRAGPHRAPTQLHPGLLHSRVSRGRRRQRRRGLGRLRPVPHAQRLGRGLRPHIRVTNSV